MTRQIHRRWFRFSTRSLLVLVLLLAVPMGWLGYQLNWIRQRSSVRHQISANQQLLFADGMDYRDGKLKLNTFYQLRDAPWSLRIFGESGIGVWILGMPNTGPEIERIRALYSEAAVQGRPRKPRAEGPSAQKVLRCAQDDANLRLRR
jgi:hypothetical protein